MQSVKLLLVGNPNAGKSTLFNRLTGGHAKVGNWHGVTVGALEKEALIGGKRYLVCDLPGIYSLESLSMEEKLSRDYIAAEKNAVILFVSECEGLPRALPLLRSVTDGRKAVLILTKGRRFRHMGGFADGEGLRRFLGIPVLFAEDRAFKGELAAALDCPPPYPPPKEGAKKNASKEGAKKKTSSLRHPERSEGSPSTKSIPPELPATIYRPARDDLSRAEKLFLNGFFCVPLFLLMMLFVFFVTFAPHFPGDVMKGAIEDFFGGFLGGFAEKIPSPVVRSLVRDGILGSLGSVLCFLPQIGILYAFLIFFEESGLLSRLAYLTDGVFSGAGLNGRAVFSLLMGFGCTAAAVLTTRGLDDKKLQRRAILCLPYIPCSAKLPVFLTLASSFFEDPFPAVAGLYVGGVALSLLAARLLRGERPPFLMELAPLQFPSPVFVFKGLLFQLKQFIIKTATVILAFLVVSWALSSFDFSFRLVAAENSMLASLCGGLKWLFAPAGMGDWRIAYAALAGLVAKENVAGAIGMFFGRFPYGGASAMAFAVFILTCSPCVSAVAATAREVGWKRALLYAAFQTASALLLCYATYFLLKGGFVLALLALLPIAAFLLVRDRIENVHRPRRHHAQKVHG